MKRAVWIWAVGMSMVWLVGAGVASAGEPETKKTTLGLILAVDGLVCTDCEAKVKAALSKLEGIKSTEVSYKKNEAVVEYDPGKATPEQIIEAVNKAGYQAQLKPEPEKPEALVPHGSACSVGKS